MSGVIPLRGTAPGVPCIESKGSILRAWSLASARSACGGSEGSAKPQPTCFQHHGKSRQGQPSCRLSRKSRRLDAKSNITAKPLRPCGLRAFGLPKTFRNAAIMRHATVAQALPFSCLRWRAARFVSVWEKQIENVPHFFLQPVRRHQLLDHLKNRERAEEPKITPACNTRKRAPSGFTGDRSRPSALRCDLG